MEKYKELIREYYNKNSLKYKTDVENYIEKYLSKEINLFLENIKGNLILDLGCGSGRDSLFFKSRGYAVLGIDISYEMTKLYKKENLEVCIMDIENLGFRNESFDGIWAYTSLLHVPKEKIKRVLLNLKNLLKKEGVLFIGMKEGDFEGYHKDPLYQCERFSSLYQDNTFREILLEHFKVLFSSRTISDRNIYLNYLCK